MSSWLALKSAWLVARMGRRSEKREKSCQGKKEERAANWGVTIGTVMAEGPEVTDEDPAEIPCGDTKDEVPNGNGIEDFIGAFLKAFFLDLG